MTDPKTCVICDGTVGECGHTRPPTDEEKARLQTFLQGYLNKPLLPLFMEAFGEKIFVDYDPADRVGAVKALILANAKPTRSYSTGFGPEPTIPIPDAPCPRCGNKTLKKTPTLLMPYSSLVACTSEGRSYHLVACTSEGCSYHAGYKTWIAKSMFPIQKMPKVALVYMKNPEESEDT